jgi:hypothetical protein
MNNGFAELCSPVHPATVPVPIHGAVRLFASSVLAGLSAFRKKLIKA